MPELDPRDLLKVVNSLPKPLYTALSKRDIYVCGGYIRAVVAGETPRDIDVFAKAPIDVDRATKDIGRSPKVSSNSHTVQLDSGPPIQFIISTYYPSAQDCIKSFDFTVCQAGVWCYPNNKGEFKWHSVCSDRFYQDLASKRLAVNPDMDQIKAGSTMMRVLRYSKMGYTIGREDLAVVIAKMASGKYDGAITDVNGAGAVPGTVQMEVTEKSLSERVYALLKEAYPERDPTGILDDDEEAEDDATTPARRPVEMNEAAAQLHHGLVARLPPENNAPNEQVQWGMAMPTMRAGHNVGWAAAAIPTNVPAREVRVDVAEDMRRARLEPRPRTPEGEVDF